MNLSEISIGDLVEHNNHIDIVTSVGHEFVMLGNGMVARKSSLRKPTNLEIFLYMNKGLRRKEK